MRGCREPRTPAEWKEAVDLAEFLLNLDSCRHYGLLTGGPNVRTERAVEVLERGKRRGVHPAPIDELVKKFIVFEGCA